MDRLSGLDASFLYLETPAQLMHVCGVIVLDPSTMPEAYSFAALHDGIEARVRDVPEFTRKLRRVPLGLDHPVWVRDKQFDIERHVHRLALPTPGGYDELTQLAGHLAGLPARPLPPAVGDVGDRGLPGRGRPRAGRGLLEDAPRHRRRRLRRQPDLAPVRLEPDAEPLALSRRRSRSAARARPPGAVRPRASSPASPGRSRPFGRWRRSRRSRASPRPSAGPARARRWRLRSPLRARRSTAPSPATARSRSPT